MLVAPMEWGNIPSKGDIHCTSKRGLWLAASSTEWCNTPDAGDVLVVAIEKLMVVEPNNGYRWAIGCHPCDWDQ